MKALAIILLSLTTILTIKPTAVHAKQFTTGFNQGWIHNRYGTQWVDGFDLNEFRRVMKLTKQANGNIVRFWLFEGYNSQSVLLNQNTFIGLNPKFVANLKLVLQAAKEENIQLNLTLFDGNMGTYSAPNQDLKNIAWNFLNNKYQVRQDFINKVYSPLIDIINLPQYQGVVTQLDLVNELNALVRSRSEVRFDEGWGQANQFVCDFYQVKQSKGARFAMTASVGWGDAVDVVLNKTLWPNCVDFFDVHIYDSDGDIDSCQQVANYAHSQGKQIYLGEFGQSNFWQKYSDDTQTTATRNFLNNAYRCGFDGALAWRLVENEDNSFLAYEKKGVLRPAYFEFQKISAQLP